MAERVACREKLLWQTKGAHYSLRIRQQSEQRRYPHGSGHESCRTLGKDEMDFYWLHRDDPGRKLWREIVDILEELKKKAGSVIMDFPITAQRECVERNWSVSERTKSSGIKQQYPISGVFAGINPEEIQPDPATSVSFPEKNISGTVETGVGAVSVFHCNGFFKTSENGAFLYRCRGGCILDGEGKHRSQVFQKV